VTASSDDRPAPLRTINPDSERGHGGTLVAYIGFRADLAQCRHAQPADWSHEQLTPHVTEQRSTLD
jgi:hypothetical protein